MGHLYPAKTTMISAFSSTNPISTAKNALNFSARTTCEICGLAPESPDIEVARQAWNVDHPRVSEGLLSR